MKKFLTFLIALVFCLSSTTFAMAADSTSEFATSTVSEDDLTTVYETRSNLNYGSIWLNAGESGGFSFNVTTSYSGNIGFTFKVESSDPSAFATISMKDPNGKELVQAVGLTVKANGEAFGTIVGGVPGTYTVTGIAYAPAGTRIMCWLY